MIELKKLFTLVDALEADEARQFLGEHQEGTYTLLRQRGAEFDTSSGETHLADWREAIQGFRKLVGL